MCIMNHTLDSVNHERDTEASVCILDRFRKISQVFSDPHVIETKQEEDENPLHRERELLKTWLVLMKIHMKQLIDYSTGLRVFLT